MNLKLNLKVLTAMIQDFENLKISIMSVKDDKTREILDKEIKDLQECALKLFAHYKKVLEK